MISHVVCIKNKNKNAAVVVSQLLHQTLSVAQLQHCAMSEQAELSCVTASLADSQDIATKQPMVHVTTA